jgi:hypothetical protein
MNKFELQEAHYAKAVLHLARSCAQVYADPEDWEAAAGGLLLKALEDAGIIVSIAGVSCPEQSGTSPSA